MICHVVHFGVIKIWTVNIEKLEAYTLTWNNQSLQHFFKINTKASEATSKAPFLQVTIFQTLSKGQHAYLSVLEEQIQTGMNTHVDYGSYT